jgi:NAD(P)-dependent dehydrogenase (short-subunit alcohol dehydrogenase family)
VSERGRVVVVTGATSGVGRAATRAFGGRGDAVALIGRDSDGLKDAAREIEAFGGRALVVPADVSISDEVERAADAAASELGPIDVWVNNAMVSVFSFVREMSPEEYERVTAVNYLGTVYGTLAALRGMRARSSGVIVQVGSGLAYRAIPLQSAYCASKHAIRAFTESLRTELLHEGSPVRVTMVQLPGLNTPHFLLARSRMPRQVRPVAPVYSPEVAARAIVYAADHPARREYVVGGVTAAMIAAQKVAPWALDLYLARTGIASQMTGEPAAARDGNLTAPLPGDPGARGPFADEAHPHSLQALLSRGRNPFAAAAALAAYVRRRAGGA